MNERVMQFRVGVMILSTGMIAAIVIALLGELPTFKQTETMQVWFERAPGVSADTPVQKSGILIGRVVKHDFVMPEGVTITTFADGRKVARVVKTGVIVTASIESRYRPTMNEVCSLKNTLLGDAVLEFVPSREEGAPTDPIDPTLVHRGEVQPQPLELMETYREKFDQAIDAVVTTSKSMGETSDTVNRVLFMNEQEVHTVLTEANKTLRSVRGTFDSANKVVGDEQMQQRMAEALNQLPETMQKMDQVVDKLDSAADLMKVNLANIEGSTDAIRQSGPEMVQQVQRTLTNLDGVVGDVALLTRALNSSEGTMGQFIHNPELYDRLNRSAANMESLTKKLRPIVDDARIISDKIARHPGVILRDAVKPGPGTKGVPGISDRSYPVEPAGARVPLFRRW